MTILTLDHVEKTLGTRHFAFDLTLDTAGIVAVLGPSGSGKSTMLNLIAGFETPDKGRIRILGDDVTDRFPGDRPLTFIFQDNNLFGHLDVAANVGLGLSPGLHLGQTEKARVSQALADVGLAGFGDRMPASLSGGERQRVAFARALVRARPVLLLDEPFAALDHALRAEMGQLLVELQKRNGALVLLVTHDEAEASRIADRMLRIKDGHLAGA